MRFERVRSGAPDRSAVVGHEVHQPRHGLPGLEPTQDARGFVRTQGLHDEIVERGPRDLVELINAPLGVEGVDHRAREHRSGALDQQAERLAASRAIGRGGPADDGVHEGGRGLARSKQPERAHCGRGCAPGRREPRRGNPACEGDGRCLPCAASLRRAEPWQSLPRPENARQALLNPRGGALRPNFLPPARPEWPLRAVTSAHG